MPEMWSFNHPYPTDALPSLLKETVWALSAIVGESTALITPVVLSAAAAAVQGVADVAPPYGAGDSRMPTSLYFAVIARSGQRKSSVMKHVRVPFEEFEEGLLTVERATEAAQPPSAYQILLEDATERGVLDHLRAGAKSVFYALDEGALLFRHLDMPALCKRYDGAPIRRNSRLDGCVVIKDTRASMCLMTQDATFDRLFHQQGEHLIESGLLPRMLMSFCSDNLRVGSAYLGMPQHSTDAVLARFHDRLRQLLREYAGLLACGSTQRLLLTLDPGAVAEWQMFRLAMEQRCDFDMRLHRVRPFAARASEQAIRLASVLKAFSSMEESVITQPLMRAACNIISWHLFEAERAFGDPPPEIKARRLSAKLYGYFCQCASAGETRFRRSDLLRNGPSDVRTAEALNIAIGQLIQEQKIRTETIKGKTIIYLPGIYSISASYAAVGSHSLRP